MSPNLKERPNADFILKEILNYFKLENKKNILVNIIEESLFSNFRKNLYFESDISSNLPAESTENLIDFYCSALIVTYDEKILDLGEQELITLFYEKDIKKLAVDINRNYCYGVFKGKILSIFFFFFIIL